MRPLWPARRSSTRGPGSCSSPTAARSRSCARGAAARSPCRRARVPSPTSRGELDDRDRLRNLIQGMRARLDLREREAAALCYLHGCSRGEAARRMGVSDTRMRKLMEGSKGRAGVSAKVGELVETIRGGDFCEQQASLMRAFAFGLLDPEGERYRLAVMHRRDCPACRRYIVSLRGAAALLPPVLTLPGAGAGSLAGFGLGHQLAAAPGSASVPSLGASAATGGGASAGGSWALGAGLGAKLAAGCLLVAGIGAGCVAIEHGAKGRPRSPAAAPRCGPPGRCGRVARPPGCLARPVRRARQAPAGPRLLATRGPCFQAPRVQPRAAERRGTLAARSARQGSRRRLAGARPAGRCRARLAGGRPARVLPRLGPGGTPASACARRAGCPSAEAGRWRRRAAGSGAGRRCRRSPARTPAASGPGSAPRPAGRLSSRC